MENQLRALHCEDWVRRFPAVDGSASGPFENPAENGIWACRKSHIDVVLNSDEDSALVVLEDDVELSRYFTSIVNPTTLGQFIADSPECDILFLDCVSIYMQAPFLLGLSDKHMRSRVQGDATADRHQMDNIAIVDARDNYAYCSASYVVTPKGKRTLRHLYAQESESTSAVDMLFKHWMASGQLVASLTVPFLATPPFTNESTIPYEHLQYAHIDLRQGLMLNAIRRLLFAGDHGLDAAAIDALIGQVPRSPEYILGMKIHQHFHASS